MAFGGVEGFAIEGDPLPFSASFDILAGAAEEEAVERFHEIAIDDEAEIGVSFDEEVDAVGGEFERRGAERPLRVFLRSGRSRR